MTKKRPIVYIPAEIPQFADETYGLGIHNFQYWKPDGPFYWPYMLFSAAFIDEEAGLPDSVRKNAFVFGDSGGFQADKPEFMEQCQPHLVIKKQEANCDAGFILDKPPWKIGRDYDLDYFRRCARITRDDANIMYENQTREDFRLYGIIQGRNREEWDIWYNIITEEHDFDWWAFSPGTPSSTVGTWKVIDFMFWAKEHGMKNIHIFGSAGKLFVPVFAYLVRQLKMGQCTYDASTPPQGGVEVLSCTLSGRWSTSRDEDKRGPEFELPFCNCPVCQAFDPEPYKASNEERKYTVAYYKVHTVYFRTMRCELCNTLSDNVDDLITFTPASKPYLNRVDELLNGEVKKQGTLQTF